MTREDEYYHGPVWESAMLNRTSYFVLTKRELCSMPSEWQQRFVDLINEAEAALDITNTFREYRVQLVDPRGRFLTDPLADYRHTGPMPLRGAP